MKRLLAFLVLVPFRKTMVVDAHGGIWRGRVRHVGITWIGLTLEEPGAFVSEFTRVLHAAHPVTGVAVRSRADEGLSWCRGWTGPAADALRVAGALR